MKNENNFEKVQETNNELNLINGYVEESNKDSNKILSYGEFLQKNKNATKKERCKAIVDFYSKIFN